MDTKGQLYRNHFCGNQINVSKKQCFSYPDYNKNINDFTNDVRIRSNKKFYNSNETLLDRLYKRQDLKWKMSDFGRWDIFPFIINDKHSGVPIRGRLLLLPLTHP
ncbi:MAG: hypothetical protein ACMUEM_06900 [Flavobacteriales bacterium AspAUS03]